MFDIASKMNENEYFALDWASKVQAKAELTAEDVEMSQEIDVWAKEIGNGIRPAVELSAYLTKVTQPIYENAPFELLENFFEFSNVGEFDNFEEIEDAKNTLQAFEAARAVGNVDRTFIDYRSAAPTWKHIQLETEVTLEKLRKGGYKTVAELTAFAEEAMRNKMFQMIMNVVDALIVSGDNYGTGALSETTVDAIVDYLNDYSNEGMILGTSAKINEIRKLVPATLLSDGMKETLNRQGGLPFYRGVGFIGIPRTAKLADGTMPVPVNTVYGIAGKVGEIINRGDMRVLSSQDNNSEKIHLKFTGMEFGVVIRHPENLFKHLIQ